MCWVVSSMEHAKKMVLVDSRVLNQIKENNVYEHEKLLEKKYSRPVERKVTSATNLDIERVLEDDSVSDDQKMKMYSTALTRYLSATKNNEMPWRAPIFGKLFKLSGMSSSLTLLVKNNRFRKNIKLLKTRLFGTCLKHIKLKLRN